MKNLKKKVIFSFFAFLFMIPLSVYAQNRTITGTVREANGDPIIGASVSEKGTKNAVATNIDGKYSISVSANANTLVVSYVGMVTKDVPITGNVVDIEMQDKQTELNTLVVIGYGSVQKKDLTGPVSSIDEKALKGIPVATAGEAITGKLAGVQVTTTEGSPDADIKIRVRGGGSITQNNEPLYVVDGFPVSSISDISPSDIESIDVLKDGSSTAIYGSRGANGVIIITTKSGKAGKTQVSYNAYFAVKTLANKLDRISNMDYLNWQYELAMLSEGKPDRYEKYFGAYQDMDMYEGQPSNDWLEQIYGRTGHIFNHNINITGGSDKIRYAFSYSHVYDKAIMIGSDFSRDNLSLKLNHKPSKRVTLDYSIRYADTKVNGGGATDQKVTSTADSRTKHAMIYSPFPMKALSNDDDEDISTYMTNPITAVNDNDREQRRKTLNMAGSFAWQIIDNLTFKTELGLEYYNNDNNRFYGTSTYYVTNDVSNENKGKPAVILANTVRNTNRIANTLNYDFKKLLPNKDHSIKLLLGQEYLNQDEKILTNTIHGFPTDFGFEDALNLTSLGTPFLSDNYYAADDKLLSFFGRANYDYKSKYLLALTFRADGSSRFGEGNRWGYFPSAALAWRVSSESFMESTKTWLDDLKLRFGYGTAGNNNIEKDQIRQTYSGSTTTWLDNASSYLTPSKRMANPDLKWETTYTRNLGIDYTLFGTKLSGSFEFYLNNTKDLLIDFLTPGTGYDSQFRNMGETENKGMEVQLNYFAIDKKDYGLNFSFNIGFNKNKIKSLGTMNDFGWPSRWASTEIGNDYIIAVGGSVGEMYGYVSDGRYEVSDFEGYDEASKKWILKSGVADATGIVGDLRPGMMKLKNIAGDDNIVDEKDMTIIGDANPIHTGGFTINGNAYGFDLSASFNWSYGNDIYNANKIEYTSTSKYFYRNMTTEMAAGSRWTNMTADGQITNDPVLLAELNENTTMWSPYMKKYVFSDWAVEDGSFLRLNTLTLGYTLPTSLVKKYSIESLRFYASAYNVFCLTNYSGFDPEVSTRNQTNLTPGVDHSAYPKSRQFLFGVNLTF